MGELLFSSMALVLAGLFDSVLVNLKEPRVIQNEGTLMEKSYSEDQPVGKCVRHFLD